MHAGVLDALEIELPKRNALLVAISSVSGGSIIGGFYAMGGLPADFRDAVAEHRFNMRRDLLNLLNLIRLPTPGEVKGVKLVPFGNFGRLDVFTNLLDRVLFDGKSFSQGPLTLVPRWMICTTDLRSGNAVGLTTAGIVRLATERPLVAPKGSMHHSTPRFEKFHSSVSPNRIAALVAASGAFPGAFNSMTLHYNSEPDSSRSLQLADGGITDNRGVALLLAADELSRTENIARTDWQLNLIIASDGGKALQELKEGESVGLEFARAIDVVYATSGVSRTGAPKIVHLTPDDANEKLTYLLAPLKAIPLSQLKSFDNKDGLLKKLTEDLLADQIFEQVIKQRDARGDGLASQEARNSITALGESVYAMRKLFETSRATFVGASTLKDDYDPKEAKRLFTLGHFLVLLHRDSITLPVSMFNSNTHFSP
jgi:predicted acylesterase/phospholipase RssA